MRSFFLIVLHLLVVFPVHSVEAFELEKPVCIAPAKPGGGHDIMCRLLTSALGEALQVDVSIRYMPGGIGALAYNYAASTRQKDANTVVAASTGTALNIALHKFGKYTENDVRWLGAVGTDYGVIAVRSDASWQTLDELIADLRQHPETFIMGAAGSIGSQDWMKMALILDEAGIDPQAIRYISFEGGGAASDALKKDQIQVFPGDFTEVVQQQEAGELRVLAVLAEDRLPGEYGDIPTAREQGYDVVWKVWRGFYLPPRITNAEYSWWVNTFFRLEATGVLARERQKMHLFPLMMIGDEFDLYVKNSVRQLHDFGNKFGLTQ
ncbi:Bug family tripartite tricarboxylate transporter substrate binding protein [Desulfopila aestuarii]|uniref:Putative tricarboxylic transport membrane protein n=1 Tax=Desulfopila aestuarii DSM 18488 TaxID=1121416 RepID=A0A1M7YF85_9BACT|nr:tripartite tricarboxylate transporter substrate-binding protein [Desulfopila aestuarii]SHO51229.1 putative tricarboxylic transport membrane protein [Desulfopila aestuarii DSM 18488]